MNKIILYLALLSLVIISCNGRFSETNQDTSTTRINTSPDKLIEGKVIKIADGDTFTLIFDNGYNVRVRLNGIDTPEKKQAFSKKAKQELSSMIFNKNVRVDYSSKDRYGRVLGDVYVGDLNVNEEMIKRGMAWHYKKYSDDENLAHLEIEAQRNKIGIWSDPNPIPPWEFRKK
ncbi:thermonuclease family protein [Aequorivita viscosa]|nr:thermonuclease family protein [Aequorivita viscosa]